MVGLVFGASNFALATPIMGGFSEYESILPGLAISGGESRISIFLQSNHLGDLSERTAQFQDTP